VPLSRYFQTEPLEMYVSEELACVVALAMLESVLAPIALVARMR